MSTLERAIALAAVAHAGQKDRIGDPYVLHPLRLMLKLKDEDARIAAVLHDVVEDTPVTLEQLRDLGFGERVLRAVDLLTRRPDDTGERYFDYVRRAAADPVARQVKLADLDDNIDIRCLDRLTEDDQQRLARYHEARRLILSMPAPA